MGQNIRADRTWVITDLLIKRKQESARCHLLNQKNALRMSLNRCKPTGYSKVTFSQGYEPTIFWLRYEGDCFRIRL